MIDTHVHGFPGWKNEDILECFKICKLDKILLAASPLDHWAAEMNEGCAKIMKLAPEKIKGLIGIHPPDIDNALRDIDKYGDKGFVGIKLMPTSGYYPDDEKFLRIFEEVNARKWIVLQHCGWASTGWKEKDIMQSTRYSDPYHVEPLARVFKDTSFILAHGGGRNYYPRAWELTHYHENVFVDTCGGQGPWVFKNGGVCFDFLNWNNVLFGTDFRIGEIPTALEYHKSVSLMMDILTEIGHIDKKELVFHKNAERLFKKHKIAAD